MKRTPEHIDNIFRQRLQDAAPPPPAFVWENVERELQKRKRRFFFWIFSIGITGAGILGIWLASTTGTEQHASNPQQNIELTSGNSTAPVSSVSNPQLENKPTSINEKIAAEKASPVLTRQVEAAPKGIQKPETIKSFIAPNNTPLATSSLIETAEPRTETTPRTLKAKPQGAFFEGGNAGAGFSTALLPVYQPAPVTHYVYAIQASDAVRKSWPKALHSKFAKSKAKQATKNCYDFAKQPRALFLEAYFGPSLAQRELISSPDDRPYLNKRISTERRDLAFNGGVRASIMLKGNFLLRTGVDYTQMTEIFEYIDPNSVTYDVKNVYHPNTGLTTLDTVGGPYYGEKYQKTFNRFGMLDIPLMVGIELRKGRSGFNINAGMSLNLLFWKRGAIISPDTDEPVWFTPGKRNAKEIFRPRSGLSATASVQWFYHVKPRLRIFVEPSFEKILRPITLDSHPVDQRYGIGSLRFGLTKILN